MRERISLRHVTVLVAMTILLCVALTGCGKAKIDMSKYVTFEIEGYDSIGTATASIDYDKLEEDFGKKIKLKNTKNQEVYILNRYGETDFDIFTSAIDGSLSAYKDLSNGDTITYEIKLDNSMLACFNDVEFKNTKITRKVKELKKVEKFDPFEEVTVEYSGTDTKRKITITHPEDGVWEYIHVYGDPMYLEPGKTFELTVGYKVGGPIELAEEYGKLPSVIRKQYTVSEFKTISGKSELTAKHLEMLKTEKEYMITDMTKKLKNVSYEIEGEYWLTPKAGKSTTIRIDYSDKTCYNYYFVIYKVTAEATNALGKTTGQITYYVPLHVINIEAGLDGSLIMPKSYDGTTAYDYDGECIQYRITWLLRGYETKEEAEKIVNSYSDKFNIEKLN